MRYLAAVIGATVLLVAFAKAHYAMRAEGDNQFESAAYLHWQGQCKLETYELLCTKR
jgi:hypothetical protein